MGQIIFDKSNIRGGKTILHSGCDVNLMKFDGILTVQISKKKGYNGGGKVFHIEYEIRNA
jgi:hypothetical protein